jgi:hypothetical protein
VWVRNCERGTGASCTPKWAAGWTSAGPRLRTRSRPGRLRSLATTTIPATPTPDQAHQRSTSQIKQASCTVERKRVEIKRTLPWRNEKGAKRTRQGKNARRDGIKQAGATRTETRPGAEQEGEETGKLSRGRSRLRSRHPPASACDRALTCSTRTLHSRIFHHVSHTTFSYDCDGCD